ncbi:Fic family protein [Brachybacterium sp. AOP43-C2-M15]|uniref:Fic family protein n=1 Tax=Brachybacterium sp. AOP43-C2-M15 TaxID=3457661 RepID=UPI004034701F
MLHTAPALSADDDAVLRAIDEIRRSLRYALARPRRWNGTLRRQARARAVRGSNSIEGITVTEDQALAIVGNEEDQVSVDATWLAVKGYSDAMTYLQVLAERTEAMSEADLLALHFMVQGYDLDRSPGRYRRGEVFVHDDDSQRTVYTGPEVDAVPGLMSDYLASLAELGASDLHPMVQGAMAHLNLVMIHPFADGNGRMSRIVQSFMLYREQFSEAQFVSIEEYLGRNTTAYYDVLARTGRGRWSPERSASEWIEFALTAHYRQARTVQGRLWSADRVAELVDDKVEAGLVPHRATPALELTFSGWSLRNATYRELADVTATTASRDLSALVEAGILQRHGAKKGAWYSPADVYRTWLTELREKTKSSFDAGADPYRLASRREHIPVSSDVG